jgi:CubicO group peptidase (beta-lactamase class C family)
MRTAPRGWDSVRFIAGEPLQCAPGSRSHYSNFGYLLLGLVAENVTGTPSTELIEGHVTRPLSIAGVFGARPR